MNITAVKISILTLLAVTLCAFGIILGPAQARAADLKDNVCSGVDLNLDRGGDCSSSNKCVEENKDGKCVRTEAERSLNKLITSIVNIISVIIGILAVIFIIIGGAKFITSGGDSGKVSSAKSTVVYALVGLIIVALAQMIVRFVLGRL